MRRFLLSLLLVLCAVPARAQLGPVPHTFVAGTDILAAEVNANFTPVFANACNRTGCTMTGLLTSQQLTPSATNTYSLGVTGTRFQDLFLSRDAIIGRDISLVGSLSDLDSALTIPDQLTLTSTSVPQVQFRYDSSNYLEFTISSSGAVTLNAAGASQGFTLSDPLTVSGAAAFTSTAAPQLIAGYDGSNRLDISVNSAGLVTLNAVGGSQGFTFSDAVTVPAFSSTGIGSISGAWTFTQSGDAITLTSAGPILRWVETGVTANNSIWRMYPDVEDFYFQVLNDANGGEVNIFKVSRTGTTVDSFSIVAAQTLIANGSITAPALAFSSDTKAGLYAATDGIVVSAQDAAAGAGDEAGLYVQATTSGGDVQLAVGNGSSSNTTYRWLSSRFDLTNGNPFIQLGRVAFASLPTPIENGGALIYCTDCTVASPCASGGTGALAKRVNGAWVCN